LDVGCGSGWYLEKLSTREGVLLYGLDLSFRNIRYARGKDSDFSVSLVQGDAENLSFKDMAFDFVLCSEVIEHLTDPLMAPREISRVCRDYAIVTTPTNTTLYRLLKTRLGTKVRYRGTHIKGFTQSELLEACQVAGFTVRSFIATLVIEFPGVYYLVRNHFWAKILYHMNKFLEPLLGRFGVRTCVLLTKSQKSDMISYQR